ncbi:acyl-CoA N-acyltransferase [Trichoderma sp. SZMC 28014]
MPLHLEDMTFKDGAAYAHTYITSFQTNAYSRTSYADQTFDQRVAGVIRRWPKNYGQTLVAYKKVVDTDSGELVSWVKVGFENTDIDPKLFAPTDIPEDIVIEVVTQSTAAPQDQHTTTSRSDFIKRAEAARSRDLGNRPALVVYLCGTHPKAQRRGAGSLLMAWVTELADREGLACWVTSSEMAVPLYKKFGFVVAEEITVPLPGDNVDGETYTHTCMLREPKGLEVVV